MGFVFLVAFAWLCAGQALAVREPRAAGERVITAANPQ
jgi:hypothetical protein